MATGKTRLISRSQAQRMGFSTSDRKRKRQHRQQARQLLTSGGFFNGNSMRGTSFHEVAMWHLAQARLLAQR